VKPIYDAWVAFAEELGLRVEFNAGANCTFEEMVSRADALITTSIAEGFGLAFLEPWLAGKPLVGRNLPEITADFEQHGLDLSQLYNRLGVPLTSNDWNIGPQFFQTLEDKMRAACEAYGHAWSDERLEAARRELAGDGTVDFGILDEDLQRVVIRAVKETPSMFGDGLGDASAQVAHNRAVVAEAYGPEAYGLHLLSIYHGLLKTKPGSVRYADGQKLLDEFLNPARFNLLRT
jgi:hypothetical protein